MINTSQLKPADVGKVIVYDDGHGTRENGKLKSWNDLIVFAIFKCEGASPDWQDYTAQACNPKDVNFLLKTDIRDNCAEHYYLQSGQYTNGKKCQSCGDEIGTKF